MELLLNLLWSGLAVGSLLAYCRVGPAGRRQFRLGLGALLCILMLLLPAISATDDLHFQAFTMEDSNPAKRLMNATVNVNPASQLVWFAFSLLALLFVTLRRKTWRVVQTIFGFCPGPQFCKPIFGRAPPVVPA